MSAAPPAEGELGGDADTALEEVQPPPPSSRAELHARLQAARSAAAASLSSLEAVSRQALARAAFPASSLSQRSTPEPGPGAQPGSAFGGAMSSGVAAWSSSLPSAAAGGEQSRAEGSGQGPPAKQADASGLTSGILRPRGSGKAVPAARPSSPPPSREASLLAGSFGGHVAPPGGQQPGRRAQGAVALPRIRVGGSAARAGPDDGDDSDGAPSDSDGGQSSSGRSGRSGRGQTGGGAAHVAFRGAAAVDGQHAQPPGVRPMPHAAPAPVLPSAAGVMRGAPLPGGVDARRAAAAAAAAAADAQAAALHARECAARAAGLDKEWNAQRAALEYAVTSRDATIQGLERQLGEVTRRVVADLVATSARLTEKERTRARLASQLAASTERESRLQAALEEARVGGAEEARRREKELEARCGSAEAALAALQQQAQQAADAAEQRSTLLRAAIAAATEQCAASEAAAAAQKDADAAERARLERRCEELQQAAGAQAAAQEQRLSGEVMRLREACAAAEHQLRLAQRDAAAKERAHEAALSDCTSREAAAQRAAALLEAALHEAGARSQHAEATWAAQKRQFLDDVAQDRAALEAELRAAQAALETARADAAQAQAYRAATEARSVGDASTLRAELGEAQAQCDRLAGELQATREAAVAAGAEAHARLGALAASLESMQRERDGWAAERARLLGELSDARRAAQQGVSAERLAAAAKEDALAAALERADRAEMALADAQAAAHAEQLRGRKRLEAKEAERAALATLLGEALDCARTANTSASRIGGSVDPPVTTADARPQGGYLEPGARRSVVDAFDGVGLHHGDPVSPSAAPDPLKDADAQRAAAKAAAEARARAAAAAASRSAASRADVIARAAARAGP